MNETALSLIVIRTSDMEATLKFYSALNLTFVEEQHGAGPIHYSCVLGGVTMELYPPRKDSRQNSPTPATMIGFQVPSLEITLAKLSELGVGTTSQIQDSEWGRWVNVHDPGGRLVQVSEAPRTATI